MQEQTRNVISIILLFLASILLLAIGIGYLQSKYVFVAGIIYFILAAMFVEGILKKLFDHIL